MNNETKCIAINYILANLFLHEYGFVYYHTMSVPYLPCRFPFVQPTSIGEKSFCESNCSLLSEADFQMLSKRLVPDLNIDLNYLKCCPKQLGFICGLKDFDGKQTTIDYTKPLDVKHIIDLNEKFTTVSESDSMPIVPFSIMENQVRIHFWLAAYIYCRHYDKDNFKNYFEGTSSLNRDSFLAELLDFYNREFYVNVKGDCKKVYLEDVLFIDDSKSKHDYSA